MDLNRFAPEHRPALRRFAEQGGETRDVDDYIEQLIPQPFFDSAHFHDLPDLIDRKCCLFKSCGNTSLYRDADAVLNKETMTASVVFGYRRQSNDDWYFSASSVEELVEQLNDPKLFPVEER